MEFFTENKNELTKIGLVALALGVLAFVIANLGFIFTVLGVVYAARLFYDNLLFKYNRDALLEDLFGYADVNDDGVVDGADLEEALANFTE